MPGIADVAASARRMANSLSVTPFKGAGKFYEAWLMLELALALKNAGWVVQWRASDHDAQPLPVPLCRVAVFRGGPGRIKPASAGTGNPGYVHLTNGNRWYELHNSVQFAGASGVLHEVDISAIAASEGHRLRSSRPGGAPFGLPPVALELKRYSGDISIGLARSALLAAIDLALLDGWQTGGPIPAVGHSKNGRTCRGGSLKASLVVLVTTAHHTGACGPLTAFYGADTRAAFILDVRARPGTQPAVVNLAADAQQHLR